MDNFIQFNLENGYIYPYICITKLLHNIIKLKDMERLILKQEYVDAIKKDGLLYGEVAAALNRTPGSLRKILVDNDQKLTQASVLRILCKHLGGLQDSDLLTVLQLPPKPARRFKRQNRKKVA